MFPGVDGFSWSAGNIIFLGIFYTVVLIIAATMIYAVVRAVLDIKLRKAEAIRWDADFEDLPIRARSCRHELAGEVRQRTCRNAFACGNCAEHSQFLKARAASAIPATPDPADAATIFGFELPLDRLYHRGHTWVRPDPDGTLMLGLDDFGSRLLGVPDNVELPAVGARLRANGTACIVLKNDATIRILSPVDGEVVEARTADAGWLLRVRPENGGDTRHLLQGHEVRPWILREMERLELALASEGVGLSLADGGEVVRDVPAACPGVDWPEVWGEMFLVP
jgi:glycine cleavage system H protein